MSGGAIGTGVLLKKHGRAEQLLIRMAAPPATGAARTASDSFLRAQVATAARLALVVFRLRDPGQATNATHVLFQNR